MQRLDVREVIMLGSSLLVGIQLLLAATVYMTSIGQICFQPLPFASSRFGRRHCIIADTKGKRITKRASVVRHFLLEVTARILRSVSVELWC